MLVIIGSASLAYPYVNFWLAERNQSYVVQQYNDSLEKLTAAQLQDEWDKAVAYNETLSVNSLYDPFGAQVTEMDEEYTSLLNLDDNGIMSRIKIPKIDVDLPVFHGTSQTVLKGGVGHMEGSALPVGGEGTHAVLTGHTGLTTAKLFTDLRELEIGDEFYIYTLNQVLAYRIDQITTVEPTDIDALYPVEGEDHVTLLTCTPYGVNSHRLLVRGERVPYTPEEIEERINDTDSLITWDTWLLIAGIALLVLFILIFVVRRIRARRKRGDN